MITFFPKNFSDIGTYNIEVEISDGQPLKSIHNFSINVVNNPPHFVNKTPESTTIKFNQTSEFILPPMVDDESNPIYYYLLSSPPSDAFIKKEYDRFYLNPTIWPQLSKYNMQLILSDH